MKFAYCPKCNTLQPRRWSGRQTCMACFDEVKIIKVPFGIYGWAALASSMIALIVALAQLLDVDLGLGDLSIYVFLAFMALTYAFMFLEIGVAERKAWQILGKQKPITER